MWKHFFTRLTFIESLTFLGGGKNHGKLHSIDTVLEEICVLERLFIRVYFYTFLNRIFFRLSYPKHIRYAVRVALMQRFWNGKLFHDPIKFNQVQYFFYDSFSNQITWAQRFISSQRIYSLLHEHLSFAYIKYKCCCYLYFVWNEYFILIGMVPLHVKIMTSLSSNKKKFSGKRWNKQTVSAYELQ